MVAVGAPLKLQPGTLLPEPCSKPGFVIVIGAALSYVTVCPLRLSVTLAAATTNAVPEVVTSVASLYVVFS